MIKVLVIKHNKEPEIVEIENDFKAMQNIVEGNIEFMPFDKDNAECECMVNEEYLILAESGALEFNRYVKSDYHPYPEYSTLWGVPVYGAFAIVRNDFNTGECVSLTGNDIARYKHIFRL